MLERKLREKGRYVREMRRSIFRGLFGVVLFLCVGANIYLTRQSEEKEMRSLASIVLPSIEGSMDEG